MWCDMLWVWSAVLCCVMSCHVMSRFSRAVEISCLAARGNGRWEVEGRVKVS